MGNAGSIHVTDEVAASGKQSLKFADAPGQTFSFNPHLWYSPRFAAGTVRESFDVRIEPGAIGHFEWREYSFGDYDKTRSRPRTGGSESNREPDRDISRGQASKQGSCRGLA
jgi:hypothetical protein